jgi:hypothetical protein
VTTITMEDSVSECERHRCEVRYVLQLRVEDRNKAMEYLSLVREKRKEKANKLELDCRKQWELGNRGDKGDWRE